MRASARLAEREAAFVIGQRIGPYEVIDKLGEGGMGEVYRARDTRLDRTVAIKILRASFNERFEREAKSISALNHPHICTLHDVGHTGEFAYLVMEYVEGSPISGPLSASEVLKLGIQICEALHAAHQKGIVHRDLKPANVLATKGGIKLLDFGLAKPSRPGASQASEQATVAALTGAHTIVGTPQYMAPEQIEGREVDVRTDIFALGCVLYELVTGKRAFEGRTPSSIMAAILATEPRKPSELAPVTPPALEWVILRCLEKDPDARWQSAHDVALQLNWIGEQPASAVVGSPRAAGRPFFAGLIAGALGSAGVAAAMWFWSGSPASPATAASPDQFSFTVATPANITLAAAGEGSVVAMSPDGRTLAFVGTSADDSSAIYLRRLDDLTPAKVSGTEGARTVFFNPNGQWLGFNTDGKLRRVPIGGGTSLEICDALQLRGSVWLADDTIVFSPLAASGLMRVPAQGGKPVPLTELDVSKNDKTHRSLIGLPDGKTVVYVVGSNEIDTYDEGRIVALNLETKKAKDLATGYAPAFSPTGHLLYVHKGTVFARTLNPVTLEVGGSPEQVLKDVATEPNYGSAAFAVSPTGVLAYAPGGDRTELTGIRWFDRLGNIQSTGEFKLPWGPIRMSPDGRRIAIMRVRANNSLFASDIDQEPVRITYRQDVDAMTWGPDSTHVTYSSGLDVRTVAVDGARQEDVLIPAAVLNGRSMRPAAWSKDGQTLALTIYTPGKGLDVEVFSRQDRKFRSVANTRYDERAVALSPDGRWLLFFSREGDSDQLFVHDLQSGKRHSVPSPRAGHAEWTKEGRELITAVFPNTVLAMSFTPASPPVFGKPEQLLKRATPADLALMRGGTVTPDGSRFAFVLARPQPPLTEIRVVTNWARELLK